MLVPPPPRWMSLHQHHQLHQAALNLPGWPQFIQHHSFTSQPPSVTSGVPQGSIPGPSLFIPYLLPFGIILHQFVGGEWFSPVYRWFEWTVGYSSARGEEKMSQDHSFLHSISMLWACSEPMACLTSLKTLQTGRRTHLSQGPGHQALQYWPTVFMEEVNFIQNEETHNLRQSHIANALSCDNIPLFWSRYQHLKNKEPRCSNKVTYGPSAQQSWKQTLTWCCHLKYP